MDYQLIVVIGMMLAMVFVSTKTQMSWWPTRGRSGYEYQRVISAAAAGLLFFVAGLIGWDLKYSHGWFQGTKWVDAPIWWQVGLGAGLLLLAVFWARRVPARPTPTR
jgi:hypothetical protein